jgi:hypothetical protein
MMSRPINPEELQRALSYCPTIVGDAIHNLCDLIEALRNEMERKNRLMIDASAALARQQAVIAQGALQIKVLVDQLAERGQKPEPADGATLEVERETAALIAKLKGTSNDPL